MRARDIAQPFPAVTADSDVLEAARAMAAQAHPGLVIVDGQGRPTSVLPGSQVMRALVPAFIQEEPTLAHAIDEPGAEELMRGLSRRTVRELLPANADPRDTPIVDSSATILEIAAVMARVRSPLVAVTDDDGLYLGAITVSGLLSRMLGQNGADT